MKITLPMHEYIIKYYNSQFEQIQKDYQITQIEIDILAFLANNPQYIYAKDIVDVRGISKAHVSIGIEKLVKRGYLSRQPDPDNRRCNILKITSEAKELVIKIQTVQKLYKQKAYANLASQDVNIFNQVLTKIYQNLGGKVNE